MYLFGLHIYYKMIHGPYDSKLVNNVTVWVKGQNRTWVLRNFNIRGSEVSRKGEMELNQPLIYINPFPHLQSKFFICPFQLSGPKKYFWVEKILDGHLQGCLTSLVRLPIPHPPTPPSQAYAYRVTMSIYCSIRR